MSVLTGDGEHFCSGLDLAALRGQPEKVRDTFTHVGVAPNENSQRVSMICESFSFAKKSPFPPPGRKLKLTDTSPEREAHGTTVLRPYSEHCAHPLPVLHPTRTRFL